MDGESMLVIDHWRQLDLEGFNCHDINPVCPKLSVENTK